MPFFCSFWSFWWLFLSFSECSWFSCSVEHHFSGSGYNFKRYFLLFFSHFLVRYSWITFTSFFRESFNSRRGWFLRESWILPVSLSWLMKSKRIVSFFWAFSVIFGEIWSFFASGSGFSRDFPFSFSFVEDFSCFWIDFFVILSGFYGV